MNALAPRAEEGRGKLRKATKSCKQVSTRRYPNGATRLTKSVIHASIHSVWRATQGTETSKYLKEKKEKSIPLVAASETGLAQTMLRHGVVGPA